MFNERKPFKKREPRKDRDSNPRMMGSRSNRYILPPGTKLDYKNLNVIQKYVTERGKIVSRRISGISAKKQRELVTAINRARFLGLLTTGVRKR